MLVKHFASQFLARRDKFVLMQLACRHGFIGYSMKKGKKLNAFFEEFLADKYPRTHTGIVSVSARIRHSHAHTWMSIRR